MAELSITRGLNKEQNATVKSCCWSVTINNPTAEDLERWKTAKSLHWVKDAIGQIERGAEGTEHIQGMLKTESVRFSQVKKAFPRAHIEAARNQTALQLYVQKDATKVATLEQTKVGTASDIQEEMMTQVYQWFVRNKPAALEDPLYLYNHRAFLEKSWETFLDTSVEALMIRGYYGLEFSVCNPQVRSAFRRYFFSMIIRQDAKNRASSSQPPSSSPASQSAQTTPTSSGITFDGVCLIEGDNLD